MRLASEWVGSVKQVTPPPPPVWVDILESLEDLNRANQLKEAGSCFLPASQLWLGRWPSPSVGGDVPILLS